MTLENKQLSKKDILVLSSIGLVAYAENLIEQGVESITPTEIRNKGMMEYHYAQQLEDGELD